MKKKIIIPVSIVLILAFIAFMFFKFTRYGENIWYYTFGGASHLRLIDGDGTDELFWFDANHSNDPTDIMFPKIEESFLEFKPSLVLVEGGSNSFEGSREEALLEGEPSFATYLAKQQGIVVEDIEPPFSKQIEYLQTKYSPEEIMTMYIFRQLGSYQMLPNNENINFEQELLLMTDSLIEHGLNFSCNSVDDIIQILNQFSSHEITNANWDSIYYVPLYRNDANLSNGTYEDDNVIINVYNDMYLYRNIYLVELIAEKKAEYDRIFIMMGSQHMIDTKEELEELYQ